MKHSKFVWERFSTAIKIDKIPLFDVRCWTFDAYSPPEEDSTFNSFLSDQTGGPLAGGRARMKNQF